MLPETGMLICTITFFRFSKIPEEFFYMGKHKHISIRASQINYYTEFHLYYKTGEDRFALYKPPGKNIESIRLTGEKHPVLYIVQEDRIKAIKSLQKGFNNNLKKNIENGDIAVVKETICELVEETLSEPRSGTLDAMPETIDIMVTGYSTQPQLLKMFSDISSKDYTTAIHSVNVMALTIGFCFYSGYSIEETKRLGLSALLHDVGKTEISSNILTAARKLTDHEFKLMKSHTTIGVDILSNTTGLDSTIAIGALEHHEKLDGTGYPKGITDISSDGKLLGLIDCYEALTNEERPYRRAKKPFDTMLMLQEEVNSGKLSRKIYEKFCSSLV